MSSLLQSILSSKLSAATLEDQQHHAESSSSSSSADARHLDEAWEEVNTSDDEIIGVQTAPGTRPGTPVGGGPKVRSSLSQDRPVKVKAPKSKTDPLRSLPKEVSQRIFLSLSTRELCSLSCVNKRYRRSATLNYCWYRQCLGQSDSENASTNTSVFGNTTGMQQSLSSTTSNASGTAHWTRRESKTDWKKEYIRRRQQAEKDRLREEGLLPISGSASGTATPSRSQRLADSGIKTARETREEQWEQEAQDSQAGYTKNELRAYYKEAGGSKGGKGKGVKAKSGKGSSRAGADDLWE